MVDEERFADAGARVDLDAGEGAAQVGDEARREREPSCVKGVGEPVELPGVKARVGEDHLEGGDGGGIAVLRRLDVTSNAL